MSEERTTSRSTAHADRLPVLGVPTTFASPSPEVVALAAREYGAWRALPPHVVSAAEAVVRVAVEDRHLVGSDHIDLTFTYTVPERHRMEAWSPWGHGAADTRRREAIVHLDDRLLAHPEAFLRGLLEPLTLFLLGALDRVPLHAAAVVRDGVGVVIAGPSGAGKSTLAYAATRAGFSLLADDPVYVQVDPELRVWGRHGRVHLRPDAVAHFPEIAGLEATDLPGSKRKLVVDRGGDSRYVERVGLCLLRRGFGSEPSLVRISPERAALELGERLDPGFDLFRADVGERVARIAERGAWILDPGERVDTGVALLEEAAAMIARGP